MQFMFSRKSGIVLAALLGVQLILPASGWALTGRDVALRRIRSTPAVPPTCLWR